MKAALVQVAGVVFCWLLLAPIVRPAGAAESETGGWIPNAAAAFADPSLPWPPPPPPPLPQANASSVAANSEEAPSGRAFRDDSRLETGGAAAAAGFDFGDYASRGDDYKAVPVAFSFDSSGAPPAAASVPASAHLRATLQPASLGSTSFALTSTSAGSPFDPTISNVPPSYRPHSHGADSGPDDGYHYAAPQYVPPPPLSAQYLPTAPVRVPNLEIPSDPRHQYYYYYQQQQLQHQRPPAPQNGTAGQPKINTANRLFVQPGKCSNSIQVGRVRDVEVRTALEYGTDTQKGVCVLMLYAPNELNELAISLQAVQGTTNVIPTGTWLETNVKVYALQAGDIRPIFTKSNFGANSPALILTRSNIVILSFYVDRPVDFFLDISTYQSLTC